MPNTKRILITGAFGNLGILAAKQALAQGYSVRCFDVPTVKNRRLATVMQKDKPNLELVWGDIRQLDQHPNLLKGCQAVIHLASVLPPLTETNPDLAAQINVHGTQQLLQLAEQQQSLSSFIYASSVTVFGPPRQTPSVKNVHDATQASDQYTHHKLQCETLIQSSSLPWTILRVGVAVDSRTTQTDWQTLQRLLRVHPDNALEYVHPNDVAVALCNALRQPQARQRVLLIGGGPSCRVTQQIFLNAALNGCGLTLKANSFGNDPYYTHWMDTQESQQLLNYQRHQFSDYQQEMAQAFKHLRYALLPIRPLANWLLNRMVYQLNKN